jgi:hypothetical protein
LWNSKSLDNSSPALSNNRKAVVEKVQKNLGKADRHRRERERERERKKERKKERVQAPE